MNLNVVSLFAGVGGIDLAARNAGMTTRLLCEKDEACRAVLARHYPEAVIHPDVTELTADDLHRAGAIPGRTVLTAGWPCQGNSVAGRRGGMGDERSGLWSEVRRILADFRPAWFVGENVPGLLSVNDGRDFGTVIGDLAELGYGFAWRVLDAQFFGVPQRRRRVVIVGCLGDAGAAPVEILFEPESGGRDSAASGTPGQSVAATLTAGISRPGVSAPGRRQEDDVNLVCVTGAATHALTAEGADASEDGTGRGTPLVATCITAREAKGPDSDATTNLVIGSLMTPQGGWRVGADEAAAGHLIAFAGQAGGNNSSAGAFKDDGTTPTLPRSQTLAVAFAENQRGEVITKPVADSLKVGGGKPGQGYPAVAVALRGREGGATAELGDDKSNALRASQGGGDKAHTLTADTVRRLTPLECERLQGFPDNWTDGQSDSARYKQMGNSVAVPVFTWVLSRLAAVDASEVAA